MPDPKNEILKEQLAYYNARSQEYDESVQSGEGPDDPAVRREWHHLVAAVHGLPRSRRALELACGTGIWTRELLDVADRIVALDGAPEMLEVNRAKLGSPKVSYQQADLFHWKTDREYDLFFFFFCILAFPRSRRSSRSISRRGFARRATRWTHFHCR